MKRLISAICSVLVLFSLSGCASESGLRYEECVFTRDEHYDNWAVESYEGVTAEIVSASSEALAVKLHNGLDHDIEFQGWSRANVFWEDVWYSVLPPKDIATVEPGFEKTLEEQAADTILPGESKEFSVNFPDMYQGEPLPSGNYRISITFMFISPRDPQRTEHEKVWIDFAVD